MIQQIRSSKGNRKLTALTCYDYTWAKILGKSGVDFLLVGDSLGMVVLGYENTHLVTMQDMISHTQAVMRAVPSCLVVADMPIGSCETEQDAISNCHRLLQETGVKAVKIEGKSEIVEAVVGSGIEVMGHTGLKPQEAETYQVRGKGEEAEMILKEALALEKAGCFALVLECIPSLLAKETTEKLTIPTIGIGAGKDCDGQILVLQDILGLFDDIHPRFVRRYANLKEESLKAVGNYIQDVKSGDFPNEKESY